MNVAAFLALGLSLALSFGAGAIGATASVSAPTFYAELVQPAWAPPAWLFGPVWTVLYLLMGIAAWLVWRERPRRPGVDRALAVYVVQLGVNALWSWTFFAWRDGGLAFFTIAILAALITVAIVLFHRIRPAAGALLVPYLAWVLFAAALNASLWIANPTLL